jgi:LDH2 family malate/lactate/ureidoglycolate dehydrogenase
MTEASETIVELLSRAGMSREKADSAAEVIQDAFRTWSERKGIRKCPTKVRTSLTNLEQ